MSDAQSNTAEHTTGSEDMPRSARMGAMFAALVGAFFLAVEFDAVALIIEKAAFDAYGVSWANYAYAATLFAGLIIGYRLFRMGYASELEIARKKWEKDNGASWRRLPS